MNVMMSYMCWWLDICCDFMAKIENKSIKNSIKIKKLHCDIPVIKITRMITRMVPLLWPWIEVLSVFKYVTHTYIIYFHSIQVIVDYLSQWQVSQHFIREKHCKLQAYFFFFLEGEGFIFHIYLKCEIYGSEDKVSLAGCWEGTYICNQYSIIYNINTWTGQQRS